MRRRRARIALTCLAVSAATTLMWPLTAGAHGLAARQDLPVPAWMFAWAATLVLIVSFVGLAVLWDRPKLERSRERTLIARVPAWVEVLCGLIGVGLFALVVYSGVAGTSVPTANLAPTFIYVLFWVALAVASALLGDIFRAFNPWRATARAAGWAARRLAGERLPARRAYPQRLGRWPAALLLVAFGWLELAYVERDDPAQLGWLAIAYAAIQLAGMARYGVEPWSDRGDGFGVYFSLFARLAPLARRGDRIVLRRPLAGTTRLDMVPGTLAVLIVMIGTTTFDGATNGELWANVSPDLHSLFTGIGFGATAATELAYTVGLAVSIGLIAGVYRLGIAGMRSVAPERSTGDLARRFAHTLIPIALAYLVAHYFSLVVFQGQTLFYLVSDPLGTGADIFGTASTQVNYALFSASFIWYVQVIALIVGHVGGLALAHDRALTLFRDPREATRSQYWMLSVMVGYTCLGLWLLSAVSS